MSRFVYDCHMRWGDMDAFAHVNNTAYVTYLEQARVAMFFDRYDSSFARGTVIARHEIDYKRPVVYHPEPLRIELWVDRVGGASFQVHYEVFDGDRLAVRALTVCVPFDFTTDRPRRLTAEERDVLAGFADDAPMGGGQAEDRRVGVEQGGAEQGGAEQGGAEQGGAEQAGPPSARVGAGSGGDR